MKSEVTIVHSNHPILISFPEQSDYEKNKTRIKRIIKTKYKLNKFVYATGEWYNENDIEKSIVVKRFTDEKGYTNALLFKGSQQLVDDVKTLLDSLKIKYEEKEVIQEELPEQHSPILTPPVVPKPSIIELTPKEILKMHKETENGAYKNYAAGRIMGYNEEIDRKVSLGLLDEEQGNKMKEEFSGKMDSFIHKWSEAGDKWLKERLAELSLKEAEPEDDFEAFEKPKEFEPIKKKKARRKVKK